MSSGSYSKLIQVKMKLFYKSKCFNSADKTIDMLLSLDKVAYSKFIKKWVYIFYYIVMMFLWIF